jgi:hypothetical protein
MCFASGEYVSGAISGRKEDIGKIQVYFLCYRAVRGASHGIGRDLSRTEQGLRGKQRYYGNVRCQFHPICLVGPGGFFRKEIAFFPFLPTFPSGHTQGGKKPSLQSVEHRGVTSDFSKALPVRRLVG